MTRSNAHDETLEHRVARLEGALRGARRALLAGLALLVLALMVAWRAEDQVRTPRLVLTNGVDSSAVVLRAVPPGGQPGLILETADGRQILVLGGDPVRLVR